MSEMATYGIVPQKIELKPQRYHGYAVILFILGTLFPPLAVAARFGIGKDFWLNLLLTICGYIPGHGHNFYIQNIRNNKNHARTPKWVQKYGLVDLSEIRRKERKSQWAGRYKDRLPRSTYEGQAYEDGQVADSSTDPSLDPNGKPKRQANGELWRPEDESYYSAAKDDGSSSRWHYPANFDDAVLDRALLKQQKKKKKDKKNRWERTQDAYSTSAEDEGSSRKRSKKKKKKSSATESIATQSTHSGDSQEYPEDAEGGLYGNTSRVAQSSREEQVKDKSSKTTDEVFGHQF
ncbi:hypothetical protein FA15DRAFT_580607 [Coprinopsis marcescibilis]|uniref:Uncharacterized protein n=1 Tax=Coprinopsis marcescibilis TaxID=230819 RepID=A0A5C3LAV3_COPMA|nr:hypothetical protein FA15DRAFT_580607 [Coprinopsis marcescibilis]